MSDNVSSTEEVLLHNYLHMIAMSFVYFDHFITFDAEIEYLWKQPKTPSARLFFLNRYLAFFGNICVTVLVFTTISVTSCRHYNLVRQTLLIISQIIVCILLTMRIYAIYACSLRVLYCMVASAIILLGVSCWSLFGQKHVDSTPVSGCHIGLDRDTAIRIASAWEALFVYDTIIFSFTLFKTYKERRNHITPDILSLILRDGAIYFAVMAFANLSNILTFYLAPPFLRGSLSSFASCISVTMMSRLMLNLHQTATAGIFSAGFPTNDLAFQTNQTAAVQLDEDDTESRVLPTRNRLIDCA